MNRNTAIVLVVIVLAALAGWAIYANHNGAYSNPTPITDVTGGTNTTPPANVT